MAISKEDVEHIALLSRLTFNSQEIEACAQQLSSILAYMEKMNTLDTEGVEPAAHVLPLKNVFREDVCKPGLPLKDALANDPENEAGQFRVPRIV